MDDVRTPSPQGRRSSLGAIGAARIRRSSVSAPDQRVLPGPEQKGVPQQVRGSAKKSKLGQETEHHKKYRGVAGVKFYDLYAERVAGLAPKKKTAMQPEGGELKMKKLEVNDMGFANEILTRRLDIAESRIEEHRKLNDELRVRHDTAALMQLQTEEQQIREALKWGWDTSLVALRTSYMLTDSLIASKLESPLQSPARGPPETVNGSRDTKDLLIIVERLQAELLRERGMNQLLRQNDAHTEATKSAQTNLKVSGLETENFKLSVQKRLDDVELKQQRARIEEYKSQIAAQEEKINRMKERLQGGRVPSPPPAPSSEPSSPVPEDTLDPSDFDSPEQDAVIRSHSAPHNPSSSRQTKRSPKRSSSKDDRAPRFASASPTAQNRRTPSGSPPPPQSLPLRHRTQLINQCIKSCKPPAAANNRFSISPQANNLRYSAFSKEKQLPPSQRAG